MLVKALEKKAEVEVPTVEASEVNSATVKVDGKCDCCCVSHHKRCFHTSNGKRLDVFSDHYENSEVRNIFDSTFQSDVDVIQDRIRNLSSEYDVEDEMYRTLTALETNFNLAS